MNDDIQKEASANAKPGEELPTEELPTEELSNISGGVVKLVDKASPNLFIACATGEHYPTK